MDLAIKAGLADATFDEDLTQARRIVGEIRADAAGALENLRDLARGISHPAAGRPGAGRRAGRPGQQVPRAGPGRGRRIGRFGQDTRGGGVFLQRLEALQNTAKYAHASQGPMRLRQAPERF